jgi:hypothetical protein
MEYNLIQLTKSNKSQIDYIITLEISKNDIEHSLKDNIFLINYLTDD